MGSKMECPPPIEGLLRIKKCSGVASIYKRRHVRSGRGCLEIRKQKTDGIPLSHIHFSAITDIDTWTEGSVHGMTVTSVVSFDNQEKKVVYRIQGGTRDYRNYWYAALRQLWTYYNFTGKTKIQRLTSSLDLDVVKDIKNEHGKPMKIRDRIKAKCKDSGKDMTSGVAINRCDSTEASKDIDIPISELKYSELIDRLRVLNQTQALMELEVIRNFEDQHRVVELFLKHASVREAAAAAKEEKLQAKQDILNAESRRPKSVFHNADRQFSVTTAEEIITL